MASKRQNRRGVVAQFLQFPEGFTRSGASEERESIFFFGGMPTIYKTSATSHLPREFRDIWNR